MDSLPACDLQAARTMPPAASVQSQSSQPRGAPLAGRGGEGGPRRAPSWRRGGEAAAAGSYLFHYCAFAHLYLLFLQLSALARGGGALLRHARAARAVEPAAAGPAAPARPQVVAHVRAGRLGRPRSDALHEVAVEVAARSLLAPAPLQPRALGRAFRDPGRAGRGDAAPALLGLARTFPLAPGGLVAPPPPHHALANDFARYVRPLPLGGGDGRTRASRVDLDDRLLRHDGTWR